MLEHVILKI